MAVLGVGSEELARVAGVGDDRAAAGLAWVVVGAVLAANLVALEAVAIWSG
jgi:hypothetical protein